MSDDKIVDLIDQLIAEPDCQKQKALMEQVCQLLAEERKQSKIASAPV